jgi:GRASP55/65 PDZ-like domain
LGELVEDHLNRSLVLWVYNSEFDVVREVELIPRRGWGGEGALGAVLGFGALHRLPVGLGEEIQAPGEKLFEAEQRASMEKTADDVGYFVVPAESNSTMQQQPPPFVSLGAPPPPTKSPGASSNAVLTPGAAARHGRKTRHHGGASPNRAFEDMFAEGEKKSQEQDFVPSRKGTPVAPPPKLGGSEAGIPMADPPRISPSPSPAPAATEDIGQPGEAETT